MFRVGLPDRNGLQMASREPKHLAAFAGVSYSRGFGQHTFAACSSLVDEFLVILNLWFVESHRRTHRHTAGVQRIAFVLEVQPYKSFQIALLDIGNAE